MGGEGTQAPPGAEPLERGLGCAEGSDISTATERQARVEEPDTSINTSQPSANPAPLQPCQECPWRRSNADRPAPEPYEDSYTRDHHVRCWRDVAVGSLSVCHLTAGPEQFPMGSDPRWVEGGYKAVPENVRNRECAGSVIAALREVRRVIAAGSIDRYVAENPQGMTAPTAAKWLKRLEGEPVDQWPELRQPNLAEAEIIDPSRESDPDFIEMLDDQSSAKWLELLDRTLAQVRQASGDV